MLRLAIGYPAPEIESEILASHGTGSMLTDIDAVTDARGVAEMVRLAHTVHVAPTVRRYIVDLVEATRTHTDLYLGASPRASILLLRATRALAAAQARDYVVPDDVKELALPVLSHRLIVGADAVMGGRTAGSILTELLAQVPVPVTGREGRSR